MCILLQFCKRNSTGIVTAAVICNISVFCFLQFVGKIKMFYIVSEQELELNLVQSFNAALSAKPTVLSEENGLPRKLEKFHETFSAEFSSKEWYTCVTNIKIGYQINTKNSSLFIAVFQILGQLHLIFKEPN